MVLASVPRYRLPLALGLRSVAQVSPSVEASASVFHHRAHQSARSSATASPRPQVLPMGRLLAVWQSRLAAPESLWLARGLVLAVAPYSAVLPLRLVVCQSHPASPALPWVSPLAVDRSRLRLSACFAAYSQV